MYKINDYDYFTYNMVTLEFHKGIINILTLLSHLVNNYVEINSNIILQKIHFKLPLTVNSAAETFYLKKSLTKFI